MTISAASGIHSYAVPRIRRTQGAISGTLTAAQIQSISSDLEVPGRVPNQQITCLSSLNQATGLSRPTTKPMHASTEIPWNDSSQRIVSMSPGLDHTKPFVVAIRYDAELEQHEIV